MRFHLALAAGFLCAGHALGGQGVLATSSSLTTGARVRIAGPALGPSVIGRVVRSDVRDLTLDLDRGPRVVVPWSMIQDSRTSGGVNFLDGVRRGAVYGLIAAVPAAIIAGRIEANRNPGKYAGLDQFVLTGIAVPIYGAGAGLFLTREKWSGRVRPADVDAIVDTMSAPRLAIAAGTPIRLRLATGDRVSGRLSTISGESLTLSPRSPISLSTVATLDVRAGASRKGGAVRGALVLLGVTAIGIATDPLPTAAENLAVAASNAAIGAAIGARFFPTRGWMRLIDSRPR